jgi:hypothetical protein
MAAGAGAAVGTGAAARVLSRLAVRAEDLLLAGWVVLAAPLLAQGGGTAGPFESGHPVQGALMLAGLPARWRVSPRAAGRPRAARRGLGRRSQARPCQGQRSPEVWWLPRPLRPTPAPRDPACSTPPPSARWSAA